MSSVGMISMIAERVLVIYYIDWSVGDLTPVDLYKSIVSIARAQHGSKSGSCGRTA